MKPICNKCGKPSIIKYDGHFKCGKHYHEAVNDTFKDAVAKSGLKLTDKFRYWLKERGMVGEIIKIAQGDDDLIVEIRKTPKSILVNVYKKIGKEKFKAMKRYRYPKRDIVKAYNMYKRINEEF